MMSRFTGKPISRAEHIRQSVDDILTTPIGSRVMNREYGSLIPSLIDQPNTGTGLIRLQAAASEALGRWEPRLKLARVVAAVADGSGRVELRIFGEILAENEVSEAVDFTIPIDSTPGQLAA